MRTTSIPFTRRRSEHSGAWGRGLSPAERKLVPQGFDAVAEALVSGASPVAACAEVGRALALDGACLGEALSALRGTFTALGGSVPDFAATEALAVAWSEATLEFLHDISCEDPLTGLASLPHLRTRLAEVYREAERSGEPASRSHALVVADVKGAPVEGPGAPFTRALSMAAVADAVRTVFSGEETIARAGGDRVVVLVRRTAELGETVELIRMLLVDLEIARAPRLWVEGLPASPDFGVRLLSDLAR